MDERENQTLDSDEIRSLFATLETTARRLSTFFTSCMVLLARRGTPLLVYDFVFVQSIATTDSERHRGRSQNNSQNFVSPPLPSASDILQSNSCSKVIRS
jgi:hypothetical protein